MFNPRLIEIVDMFYDLATWQYDIVFCSLPRHVGISGNTMADAAAEVAFKLNRVIIKM